MTLVCWYVTTTVDTPQTLQHCAFAPHLPHRFTARQGTRWSCFSFPASQLESVGSDSAGGGDWIHIFSSAATAATASSGAIFPFTAREQRANCAAARKDSCCCAWWWSRNYCCYLVFDMGNAADALLILQCVNAKKHRYWMEWGNRPAKDDATRTLVGWLTAAWRRQM